MATVSRTYTPANRTNFDADLATITVPQAITQVNFITIGINSSNGSFLTFSAPSMTLQVGLFKSSDGGVTFDPDPFVSFFATGGAVNKGGTRVDPSATFECDPPLQPGIVVKPHITQVGTFFLGGVLSADFTP